jgi:hypothetical protein
MNEKKLGPVAEMWKNGLFLTAWSCFFWGCFAGTFKEGQHTWELLNAALIFYVAFQYLPEKIDYFAKKMGRKKEDAI